MFDGRVWGSRHGVRVHPRLLLGRCQGGVLRRTRGFRSRLVRVLSQTWVSKLKDKHKHNNNICSLKQATDGPPRRTAGGGQTGQASWTSARNHPRSDRARHPRISYHRPYPLDDQTPSNRRPGTRSRTSAATCATASTSSTTYTTTVISATAANGTSASTAGADARAVCTGSALEQQPGRAGRRSTPTPTTTPREITSNNQPLHPTSSLHAATSPRNKSPRAPTPAACS